MNTGLINEWDVVWLGIGNRGLHELEQSSIKSKDMGEQMGWCEVELIII